MPAGAQYPRQLPHRRGRVIDVAQQVGEGDRVEALVGERQPLGLGLQELHRRPRLGSEASPRGSQHRRALIDGHDRAVGPRTQLGGDQTRAGGHVEHPLSASEPERADHRRAPARVLPEAEGGRQDVVAALEPVEQLERLELAGRALRRDPGGYRVWALGLGDF